MLDIRSRFESLTDRKKWTARGAAFVGKARATKEVWFPPTPAKTGKKAVGKARKTAKKSARPAKKTAKKTTSAANK
jgi:hypothetical protein